MAIYNMDVEAPGEIVRQGGVVVVEEERVVWERRHDDADLWEIVEIRQDWDFPQQEAVRDGLAEDEGGDQMLDWALSEAGTRRCWDSCNVQSNGWKYFHSGAELVLPLSPEVIEGCDVGIHVVDVVGVQGVLRLRLVVHRVEPDDVLEETVELGVRGWVDGDFEQRPEQIIFSTRISFTVLVLGVGKM